MTRDAENKLILNSIYYDPKRGLLGPDKLYHRVKQFNITRTEVNKYLGNQEIVQVNRRPIFNRSFVPSYPLQEFQIDLIHLENPRLNDAAYGLCCIDVFTKKADIELLKRKDKDSVVAAMHLLLERMGIPESIYCDEGTEFTNRDFQNLMKEYDIEIIYTLRHAPFVERFNRTIKSLMSRYLQVTDTKTVSKILPSLIENYNNSYHKAIGMAPNEVNDKNYIQVWNSIRRQSTVGKPREKIKVGDKVRVLIKEKLNEKKYKPRWSKMVYTISKIDGINYYIDELHRKYLRAYITKVTHIEKPEVKANLENTVEGRIKKLSPAVRENIIIEDIDEPVTEHGPKVVLGDLENTKRNRNRITTSNIRLDKRVPVKKVRFENY